VAPHIDSRRLLLKPTPRQGISDPDKVLWEDLMRAFDIPFTPGSDDTERARAASVIDKTLAVKTATLTDTLGNTKTIQYLLGDIFHSNPLVVGSPPNTKYFSDDLHGYRDFFRQHELRRKMAIVGSNDGMLHVFDAGTFDASAEKFTNGTGKEIFAYIPRTVMPTLTKLAEGTFHKWGVDGTVTVADVFIDPLHGAAPVADDRDWRTVLLGGLREGGAGYFALDITQPDTLATVNAIENVPQPVNGFVPSCLDSGCDLPFPAALWEFTDTVIDPSGNAVTLDEDGNLKPDLGAAWSIPNIGRIQLSEGDAIVEKFVMVAGGGFDPDNKSTPNSGSGNWLYMIDIETGKAIYKRQLDGAVPSEPAAVDTDQDGFLDRIYVGTTRGKMYRVDLTNDAAGDTFPALVDKQLVVAGVTYTVQRVPETSWVPRLIFDANTGLTGATRPIFYRPSVIFVPSLGLYAISFGTGDREDLWSKSLVAGRFYVFVDDTDELPSGTVLDETRFQQITVTSPGTATQFLLSNPVGTRGWYLVLEPDERLITDPFALSGVTFFSTFQPDIIISGTAKDPLCSKTGTSRLFVVSTVNGNPFLEDVSGSLVRNRVVNDFVTNPFTEDRSLNTASSGSPTPPKETCDEPTMNQLRETLKTLFPVNCRFGNQTIDIKTISSKTALICIAPVPVCTVEKNWRQQ
jgi:Tfp pilus tip-associated adhesin PilY1